MYVTTNSGVSLCGVEVLRKIVSVAFLATLMLPGCNADNLPIEQSSSHNTAIVNSQSASPQSTPAEPLVRTQTQTREKSNLSKVASSSRARNLCQGLPTHKKLVSVPLMSKPPFGRAYRDPAFGARVMRISNAGKGDVVKPMYSTIQSWNADESLLLLYHTGGNQDELGHHLYDGRSYKHLKKLDFTAKDIEEVYWHHSNPDILFYVSAYFKDYGSFIQFNVRTGNKRELARFDQFCGREGVPVSGNDVMMPSWDDQLFGFRCNDGFGQDTAFSYRFSDGDIKSTSIGDGTPFQPWYAPMPTSTGKYYRLNGYILDSSLKKIVHQLDLSEFHSHASLGRLANGHDAFFATAFDPSPNGCDGGKYQGVGSLVVHDLEEKTCRVVIGQHNGYGYPGSGTHVSSVAHRQPGWVLMSTIGYGRFEYLSNHQPAPLLFSEIYLANTDPKNPQICRIAHHRSFGKDAVNVSYNNYLGEPHATLSPSGTRLVFGSDWGNSGSVDTYVVELPAYTQ